MKCLPQKSVYPVTDGGSFVVQYANSAHQSKAVQFINESPTSNSSGHSKALSACLMRCVAPLNQTFGKKGNDMSMWLYQLNPQHWAPGIFRYEVNENQRWSWRYGQKRGELNPVPGDTVVFFYAPSGGDDPGIYGWAILERCDTETSTLYFIPTAPSNWLKMDPWWDDDAKALCDEIRGAMKQATLFQVPDALVSKMRRGIRAWLR